MTSRLRTPLCKKLGIEVPVFCAGMGGAVGPELTAAVSNAGGLGVLGGTGVEVEKLRGWIRRTKELTDRPFGLDLILPANVDLDVPPLSVLRSMIPPEHAAFAEKLRKQYMDPERAKMAPEEKLREGYAIPSTNTQECIEVMFEEGVPIFVSGLGSPGFLMERARDAGMTVMGLTGNVKNARRIAGDGVDVVIAQGSEGGAHTGYIGSVTVWPQVIDAVAPIPVVAAGGVGDGRGLAAALAMGCQAVWCGSAFLPTEEANIDPWRKKRITEADDNATVTSKTYTGKNCRSLKNEWIKAWEDSSLEPLPMPLQFLVSQPALMDAKPDDTRIQPVMVGQVAGLLDKIRPAAEVVEKMVSEAEAILDRIGRFEFNQPDLERRSQ